MIRRITLFLILACITPLTWANAELVLQINKSSVELGKWIKADLYAVNLEQGLEKIDLRPLKRQFAVEVRDEPELIDDERWPDQQVQRLKLRLYPRSTGTLSIPELYLGAVKSKPGQVEVSQGSHKGEPLKFSYAISQTSVWQRQQIVVRAAITTPRDFAGVVIEDDWKPRGFEVIRIPASKRKHDDHNVLETGWILFPLVAGEFTLELPAIRYQVSSTTLRRYHLPPTLFAVKPLPPYVPPTMPVGSLSLSSSITPGGNLPLSHLAYWDIELTGGNLMPRWMPPIRSRIQSNDGVQFFPEEYAVTKKPGLKGMNTTVKLQLPFKPLTNGSLQLPEIRIDYFDPEDGRLKRIRHRPTPSIAYDPRLIWFSAAMALLLLAWGIWRVGPVLLAALMRWLRLRRLFKEMTESQSPHELRAQLQRFADIQGWPENLSMNQWREQWRSKYRSNADFDLLLKQLSQACYNKQSEIDLMPTRRDLVKVLRRRKRHSKRLRRKKSDAIEFDLSIP